MLTRGISVFSGSSHEKFAEQVASLLGVPLGRATKGTFVNLETRIEIGQSVRDMDVYIIQTGYGTERGSGAATIRVNDYLMELLIMVHACKIASAARVTAVIPCFPYSRVYSNPHRKALSGPLSDRQHELLALFGNRNEVDGYSLWSSRSGTLVANMLIEAGVDRVVTMDLHDPQFTGFFSIPVENLSSASLAIKHIHSNIPNYKNAVIVSPDVGGTKRAAEIADMLGIDLAVVHKDHVATQNALIGNVSGKDVILIDDIMDTCETLVLATNTLLAHGAARIYAIITHGILSSSAINQMRDLPISCLAISNSIAIDLPADLPNLVIFDSTVLFAEAIHRMHEGQSASELIRLV